MPYETAVSWPAHMRMSAIVVIGESKGGKFSWDSMRWVE